MSKKGVYPYDFMDSFEKFNQTELPAKEHFYSILNDQDITNDEYNHAKKVWKMFKLKNMGEYHDLWYQDKIPPDKTPPDKIPQTKSPWTKSP